MNHWSRGALRALMVMSCAVGLGHECWCQAPPPVPAILELPGYEMPDPNGYEALEALLAAQDEAPLGSLDMCQQVMRKYVDSPTEADLQQASALVDGYRPTLDGLPELLGMEWLYPRQATPGTIYPEQSKVRMLMLVLSMQSVLEEHDGDPGQAAETLLGGLRLAVKLPRGGTFYPWSTSMACEAICQGELRPLLASGKLSRETLLSVRETMSALGASRVPLREAIACDYDAQSRGALTLSAREFWELLGGPPNTFLPLGDPAADRLAKQFIIDRLPPLLRFDARMAELATQPYWEVKDAMPELPPGLPDPGEDDALVFQSVPRGVLRRAAQAACDWQGTKVMVGLELARLVGGAYPQTLAEVDGLDLDDVIDPLSGESLVYQRTGETYRLYSVSLDGVDNGGRRGGDFQAQFEEGGDCILWDGTQTR